MNPDLEKERKNATFQPEFITNVLDGSSKRTARRRQLETLIRTDPSGIFDNSDNHYLHRTERHVRALAKAVRMIEIARAVGIGTGDQKLVQTAGALEEGEIILSEDFPTLVAAVGDDLPLSLHWVMFVPNIRSLCDEEQQKLWLPMCRDFRMTGCYAQTELGHGSNVRALETTASFLSEAEGGGKDGSWKIHSPSLTSAKFWPGSLGRTANHAMVIARLIDGDKVDRGIHNFLVPLRSMQDHKMLPGVTVGDIGPKIGYNNMDNGFAIFDNVLIPRRNMAMRFASVDKHGKYHKNVVDEATSKVAYITMMQVRAYIVNEAGKNLAMACTINVRYSAVRRQGFDEQKPKDPKTNLKPELQVLDYTQQQHRIFPLVAASYCFFFTGKKLLQYLQHIEHQLVSGAGSITKTQVADLHASSSSLKSFCTTVAADGIEECRKACGGHGFLQCSGLPELLGSYLQNPTVEGDNHMLPQQSVRVLLKLVQVVTENDQDGISAYAKCDSYYLVKPMRQILSGEKVKCTAKSSNEMLSVSLLLDAFQHRAARLLLNVAKELQTKVMGENGESTGMQTAWNESLIEMSRVSKAHALSILIHNFMEGIENIHKDSTFTLGNGEIGVFQDCAQLFALYWMEKDLGDFLEDSYLSMKQAKMVRHMVLQLLKKIRPNAVALVDAWDFSDFRLKSALGRFDGNVYPAIIDAAKRDPLNRVDQGPGYKHLKKLYVDGVGKFSGTACRL